MSGPDTPPQASSWEVEQVTAGLAEVQVDLLEIKASLSDVAGADTHGLHEGLLSLQEHLYLRQQQVGLGVGDVAVSDTTGLEEAVDPGLVAEEIVAVLERAHSILVARGNDLLAGVESAEADLGGIRNFLAGLDMLEKEIGEIPKESLDPCSPLLAPDGNRAFVKAQGPLIIIERPKFDGREILGANSMDEALLRSVIKERRIDNRKPLGIVISGEDGGSNHRIDIEYILDSRPDFYGLLAELSSEYVLELPLARKLIGGTKFMVAMDALEDVGLPDSALGPYVKTAVHPVMRTKKIIYLKGQAELPEREGVPVPGISLTEESPGISRHPDLEAKRRLYLPGGVIELEDGRRVSVHEYAYRERRVLASLALAPGSIWSRSSLAQNIADIYPKRSSAYLFVDGVLKQVRARKGRLDDVLHEFLDPRPHPVAGVRGAALLLAAPQHVRGYLDAADMPADLTRIGGRELERTA